MKNPFATYLVERSGDQLKIVLPWRRAMTLYYSFVGVLLLFIGQPIYLMLVGIVLTIMAVGQMVNSTTIRLDRQRLAWSFGPVWFGPPKQITLENLSRFCPDYVIDGQGTRSFNYKKWYLCFVDTSGNRQMLFSVRSEYEVADIVAHLNAFLGVV
jgi:hypothetical protein